MLILGGLVGCSRGGSATGSQASRDVGPPIDQGTSTPTLPPATRTAMAVQTIQGRAAATAAAAQARANRTATAAVQVQATIDTRATLTALALPPSPTVTPTQTATSTPTRRPTSTLAPRSPTVTRQATPALRTATPAPEQPEPGMEDELGAPVFQAGNGATSS